MKTTESRTPCKGGRNNGYSNEELIAFLQQKADSLGCAPTMHQIDIDKNLPSSQTFSSHFGSFNNALKEAGLEIHTPQNRPHANSYSDKRLLQLLQDKAKILKHTPTVRELNADKSMPTHDTYVNRFGSYNNAIEKAGLRPRCKKSR